MSGHRGELAVQEAAEREAGLDRVDVREAGQVADDRADRAAAAAARRQRVARRAGAAHLEGDLARELEHLPVEQEEAGEPELARSARAPRRAVRARAACGRWRRGSARRRRGRRRGASWHVGGLVAVGEVGVAVAELLGEVELEPLGELGGARDGVAVVGEALGDLARAGAGRTRGCRAARARSRRARCGCGSRRARPAARARRGWCAWTSPVATVWTPSVSARSRRRALRRASPRSYGRCSSTKKRSRPKALRDAGGGVRVADGEPVARAAGEADEALVVLEQRLAAASAGGSGSRPRFGPRARVRGGEQPAEVRVALRRLDEQRDVGAAVERDLGAGDRRGRRAPSPRGRTRASRRRRRGR